MRWYGVILPMLRYNDIFDYTADFSNYTRICLDGYLDCIGYDPQVGTTTFTDPLTNYTYIASNTDRPEYAIGAKLLRDAQAFVDEVYMPARQNMDDLEANPDNYTPEEARDIRFAMLEAERELNRRTSFLDIIREISYYVDW